MEIIFEQNAQDLKQQPFLLNQITEKMLKQAAKEHHPHNKLLPASFVQILLIHYSPQNLLGASSEFQKYILSINCLRGIVVANFSDLSNNKMYNILLMNYTLSLNKLIQKQRQTTQQFFNVSLQMTARGYLLNSIMIKLLLRSRVYLPQYFRSVKISLQLLQNIQSLFQDKSQQKQLKKYIKIDEQISSFPKIIHKLCIKKQWKRQMLIVLIKVIKDQFQSFINTCGFRKLIINLRMHEQIQKLIKQLLVKLSPQEQKFIGQLKEVQQQKQTDAIYLQETIKTKELTPRFYNEQQSFIINKLRKKKSKLQKRMENDLRKSVVIKQQESHVLDEVKRQKSKRQTKKEVLILQKQTSQAKKYHKQMKKVSKIKKISKGSKSDGKKMKAGRFGK